jgi:hypothetical protein
MIIYLEVSLLICALHAHKFSAKLTNRHTNLHKNNHDNNKKKTHV